MSGKKVHALLASAGGVAECKARRAAWVREAGAALEAAMRAMDERCLDAVLELSEEEFERLVDEEQAKVDAVRAPLEAAAHRDVWPRELYVGGI